MEFRDCLLFDGETLRPNASFRVEGERFAEPRDKAAARSLGGRLVTPGLIDCHTHLVWGGSREDEFEERLSGVSYEEIMARGGGIRSTVAKTRAASEDELLAGALKRVDGMRRRGVTTVEAKSGYGLSLESELKMLRVIRSLKARTPLEVKATLLGAHAIPKEFADNRDGYVRLVVDEMIPAAAEQKLASAVDVFCESSAFTLDEARRILEAGKSAGLDIKIHSDQFTNLGATKMAAELGALSCDHLERASDADIEAMAAHGTIAVILPCAELFLNMPVPPIAKLREAGVPIAIATDCNPGSAHTWNLPLVAGLACLRDRLSPLEALAGMTSNAARALGSADRLGYVQPGYQADFVVWDCSSVGAIPYWFGENLVSKVYKRGGLIHDAASREESHATV